MNSLYKNIKKISDKIKKVDRKAIIVGAAVVVIFVVIWALYGYHISDFSKAYRTSMLDLIMSETDAEDDQISAGFAERCNGIRYVATSFSNVDEDQFREVIPVALTNTMMSESYRMVVYIDNGGLVYFPDGKVSNNYNTEHITNLCDPLGLYTVFANTDKFLADEGSFGVVAPVRRGNEIRGYVCGISEYKDLVSDKKSRDVLTREEVILDSKGIVLCQIGGVDEVIIPVKENDFFELAEASMTAEGFSSLINDYNECMASGRSGHVFADTGDHNYLYIYSPIEATDGWTIMSCYSDLVVEERTKDIQIKSVILFTIILSLFAIAVIIILNYLSIERKRLSELEYLDGLTGTYNRSAFVSSVRSKFENNKDLPYNILCFDVINFRIINETYGHERSDEIIKAMAVACKEAFGHNEAYGRLTADVYVAAVIDDGEEEERIKYIEDYVAKKAKEVYINHPIRIKRGVYSVFDFSESVDRMIDKANIARKYVDFNDNKFMCHYSSELLTDARKAEEIESCMEEALAIGEFKPYFQAKYDIVENKVCGAEALVRWIKSDGEIVPPGDFIPLFERNGFVEKIDFYMLESVCKYIRRMIDENREVYKISVNQSRYLMNDPEYVNNVKKILLRYQIPVGLIELELTETVFIHEKERMTKMMNDLKKMNVDLSIDDFGTGYSSFNILKDVPFDVIKIDRVFLEDAVHTEKGKFILKEIIQMGHGLGMSVICEGVETKEQADLLISYGCTHAQGFLYARPIPVEEFVEKYNLMK